ncbi:MAG: trypsin-like peptidase domain-containing protein [Treponemataceae bacterium]|nr:trypsin-like peptidase domain-containing protein [Treponemataceae bacterium]
MKLYSKHHLVFAAIGGALVAILVAVLVISALLFLGYTPAASEQTAQTAVSSKAPQSTEPVITPVDTAVLQTAAALAQQGYTQDETQNISVYQTYNDAVVNINTQVMAVNWFLEPVPQDGGSGSGSIIDDRGYVVTNVHVIENAYKIYISLSDGTQYEGKVIGTDAASDIAVIKFDPPAGVQLKTIPFGNSDTLKVGQKVLAIGNPFGFERTLTTGIVSGLGRPIKNSNNTIIRNMIQTDTAINPGNSGGPLLDTSGRMIGINTMIYSTSGSSAGVGFAVPINTAKRVVQDLITYGEVLRGSIDGNLVQLTSSISRYAGIPVSQGLLVSELSRKSKALQEGLLAGTEAVQYGSRYNRTTIYLGGDVITAIDGVSVATLADYYSLLEDKKPGDAIVLTIIRGKKEQQLRITLD